MREWIASAVLAVPASVCICDEMPRLIIPIELLLLIAYRIGIKALIDLC